MPMMSVTAVRDHARVPRSTRSMPTAARYVSEDDKDDDEQHDHPKAHVALRIGFVRSRPQTAEHQYRSREAADEDDDRMIEPRLLVARVASGEQTHLILQILGEKRGTIEHVVQTEPNARDACGHDRHHDELAPGQRMATSLQQPCHARGKSDKAPSNGTLRKDGQAGGHAGKGGRTQAMVGRIARSHGPLHAHHTQEDAQVEERVDDARAEVEVREQTSGHGSAPQQPCANVVTTTTDLEDHQHREHADDGIGKAGRELVDAEDVHRQCLRPQEERRLLVERGIVDGHMHVVARDQHLARALGEVDLVPVKERYSPEERNEERERADGDGKTDGAEVHDAKIRAPPERACNAHAGPWYLRWALNPGTDAVHIGGR
jgi:hypothetical protein